MSTLAVEPDPLAQDVRFTEDDLIVCLADGRTLSVPLVYTVSEGDLGSIEELRIPWGWRRHSLAGH